MGADAKDSDAKKNAKGSVIAACTCPNKFMDRRYGARQRVKNVTMKGVRCTSCGKETIGGKH